MPQISKFFKNSFLAFGIIMLALFVLPNTALKADTVSDLQTKISSKNDEIKRLEEEIKQYQTSLNQTSSKANSLKNELAALTLARKKLETELKLTEANLSKTTATITDLAGQISKTEDTIDRKKDEIGATLRNIRGAEDMSLAQIMLSSKSITDVSDYIENSISLSTAMRARIAELQDAEVELSTKKSAQQDKQAELKKLKTDLSGQKKAVADTASETNKLLTVTKNQESNYQKLLSDKEAQRAQFEQELYTYESQLRIFIDKGLLPDEGTSPLHWPLAKVYITQLFGKTSVSGRLYASGSHNGVDFRATDGTPVLAALSGTVTGTGNTDLKAGCYSYGKWVLLKHPNGLSTVYGHLSSVVVKTGDTVATGETIAYSGHTGYALGPHLHLTVFATQGVSIMQYPQNKTTKCAGIVIPIADPKAFLDPMLYLPPPPTSPLQ